MSFELQETRGSCGTASLRYALSLLGIGLVAGAELDEADVRAVLGKNRWRQLRDGTSEDEIRDAARGLGLEVAFHHYKVHSSAQFIADLRHATGRHHPCVVSFHGDDEDHFHWVCVGGFDGADVLLFDPSLLDEGKVPAAQFGPVDPEGEHAPARMSVRRLEEWTTASDPVEPGEDYHFFMEFWPAADYEDRFVPGGVTGDLLDEMREDDELFRCFDEYIDDLRTMFGPPAATSGGRSAHEFLLDHERRLLGLARDWTLAEQRPFYDRELRSLLAMTKAYDFRVA
ncbi:MAG: hypothetical protein U1E29_15795, partial [Coriobacteriia bacterium]|nr:hypothetical protein [Coriobacteriia bacterium]